jgi:hypothetical protein
MPPPSSIIPLLEARMPYARHIPVPLTAVAVAALLAACGGSSSDPAPVVDPSSPVVLSGVVADGPLAGAQLCYDLNDNADCDDGEPAAVSDAEGRWQFEVAAAAAGQHAVIAEVPADAVDKDTGAAVGTAFTLKAPPTGQAGAQEVFVSPLTTLVVDLAAAQGLSAAAAAESVQSQLGLQSTPLANFVAAGDAAAALAARTLATLTMQTLGLAGAAGVPGAGQAALVAAVTTTGLSTLAARIAAAGASDPAAAPGAVAAQVAAGLLAERRLDATTAAAQAALAQQFAAPPPPAGSGGPFVSVRRFAYTDAGNHFVMAFVGDSSATGADGSYPAHEVRNNRSGGAEQPFNRNQAYWVAGRGEWVVCPIGWQVVATTPPTATAPQRSVYCGASHSLVRQAEVDVTGRRMAEVVAEMRAHPLRDVPGPDTDASGLPTRWGPEPALLGDAMFPEGARFSRRQQTSDLGGTERYGLTDKPQVPPASAGGRWRQAATLDELGRMAGDLADPSVVVSNLNTLYLEDVAAEPGQAALRAVKRWRAAIDPAGGRARFYACNVLAADNSSQDCMAAGEGTITITAQADSRVLRFASGYPAALTLALHRQRLFVERSGVVFGGWRDHERVQHNQRPNNVAWEALRSALGLPVLQAATAPAAPGPFTVLRRFTYADGDNWFARLLTGDESLTDAGGWVSVDDLRRGRSGGVPLSGALERLYWTGSEWNDCQPEGAARFKPVAPFESVYCGSYVERRANSVTVTLDGRPMAEVVGDIRRYPTPESGFDHAGWGPDPQAHGAALAARFPAGATMEIRGTQRVATPIAISTGAGSRQRVAPADTSQPFQSWPFAASIDAFVARHSGDLAGGPLNGATAAWVWGWDLPAPPAPEYARRVEIRVAFDPGTQRARFWRNYRRATNNVTTAYVPLLDTTYEVQMLGGARLLRFAALPEGFERDFGFERIYAERNGSVWLAGKDAVPAKPVYSIRMNGVAATALTAALGLPLGDE